MAKFKYEFLKSEFELLSEEAMLNQKQKDILEAKIKGKTIIAIAMEQGDNPEKINRELKTIKRRILRAIDKIK